MKPMDFEQIVKAMDALGVDDPELIPDVYGDLEAWLPCPNHPGYEVSEFGRVRNSDTGKILRAEQQGRYKLKHQSGEFRWISIFDLLDQTHRKDEPPRLQRILRAIRERGAKSGEAQTQ